MQTVSFVRRPSCPGVELIDVSRSPESCAHLNTTYSFCTLVDWQGQFAYRRHSMAASGGDTLLLEPGEFFKLMPSECRAGTFRVLEIAPAVFEAACRAEGLQSVPHFTRTSTSTSAELTAALDALQRSLRDDLEAHAHEEALATLAHAARASLLEREPRSAAQRETVDACERLRELLHSSEGAHVSLSRFALEAEVSHFQLLRDFKRRYGSTPHAYGLHVRVERARELLRSGASIADAAAAADFVDQSHFTRYFRRVWTLTPGQYARGKRSAVLSGESSRRH